MHHGQSVHRTKKKTEGTLNLGSRDAVHRNLVRRSRDKSHVTIVDRLPSLGEKSSLAEKKNPKKTKPSISTTRCSGSDWATPMFRFERPSTFYEHSPAHPSEFRRQRVAADEMAKWWRASMATWPAAVFAITFISTEAKAGQNFLTHLSRICEDRTHAIFPEMSKQHPDPNKCMGAIDLPAISDGGRYHHHGWLVIPHAMLAAANEPRTFTRQVKGRTVTVSGPRALGEFVTRFKKAFPDFNRRKETGLSWYHRANHFSSFHLDALPDSTGRLVAVDHVTNAVKRENTMGYLASYRRQETRFWDLLQMVPMSVFTALQALPPWQQSRPPRGNDAPAARGSAEAAASRQRFFQASVEDCDEAVNGPATPEGGMLSGRSVSASRSAPQTFRCNGATRPLTFPAHASPPRIETA